jgi:hypothetical protein
MAAAKTRKVGILRNTSMWQSCPRGRFLYLRDTSSERSRYKYISFLCDQIKWAAHFNAFENTRWFTSNKWHQIGTQFNQTGKKILHTFFQIKIQVNEQPCIKIEMLWLHYEIKVFYLKIHLSDWNIMIMKTS